MKAFIALTFVLLAWVYWEKSGGSDFVPASALDPLPVETAALPEPPAAPSVEVAVEAEAPAPDTGPAREDVAALPAATPEPDPVRPPGPAADISAVADLPGDTLERLEAIGQAIAAGATEEVVTRASIAPADGIGLRATDTTARTPPAAPADAAALFAVSGDRVNLRAGPGTDYEVLGQAVQGDRAEVFEIAEGWARLIHLPTGQMGWMSERLLEPVAN